MARLLLVLCVALCMMVSVAGECSSDSGKPVDIWGTLMVAPKEMQLDVGTGTSVEAEASFSARYDTGLNLQSGWLWKWTSHDGGEIEFTNGEEIHWTRSAGPTYTAMALCRATKPGTVIVYVEQPTDRTYITFKVKNSHTCTFTISE